jgi:hypothetical protein
MCLFTLYTALDKDNIDVVDIIRTWDTIRENINISAKESLAYYRLKKHKPSFDEGCSELLDLKETSQIAMVTGSRPNIWG